MELTEKLLRVMEKAIENHEIAGMNILVEKDGREVCYCQAGMADLEKKKPIVRDTIFRLYSQTKPVTAAAAMILMERGVLDLYQPVSDFLPAFSKTMVWDGTKECPPERQMQIRDLLNMTSGLVYPEESVSGRRVDEVYQEAVRRLKDENAMTTQEFANALAACPLKFAPGSNFQYGTSADVLGAVIETASGMRYGDFLEKEILQPLHMQDTAFWVPAGKKERLAEVYETVTHPDGTRGLAHFMGDHLAIRNDMAERPAYEAGGAGLTSTLDDYMRFARMLQQEGELDGARILSPETVRFMRGAQLSDRQQRGLDGWMGLEGFSYGNLMRVCKNPGKASYFTREGEYGWDGWLGMYFANFPKEKLTILFGMQKKDAGTFELTRKLRNVILSEIFR